MDFSHKWGLAKVLRSEHAETTVTSIKENLYLVWVEKAAPNSTGPSCTGIGGGAHWLGAIEVPVGVDGVNGVMRLNVLKDTEEAPIPVLFPINLQETLGFDIDVADNLCTLQACIL